MMNSIERLQAFKDYMDACDSKAERYGGETQLIGWGNPLAPILIVGKEPYGEVPTEQIETAIQSYINAPIRAGFDNGVLTQQYLQGYVPITKTFGLYQRLIDYVLYDKPIERTKEQNLPFVTWAFVTDMNNTFSDKSSKAEKKLEFRKNLFEDSRFLRDFPVVLLACGKDYIDNNGPKWEINRLFDVTFDMEGEKRTGAHEEFGKGVAYFTHHSQDGRLVIHTSQITAFGYINNRDEALKAIAKLIREHLIEQGKFPNFWIQDSFS